MHELKLKLCLCQSSKQGGTRHVKLGEKHLFKSILFFGCKPIPSLVSKK